MANLNAAPGWDAVPQLEKTDVIMAGPGGRANAQAQALANRTELLKGRVFNISDYSSLVFAAVAKSLGDPASHISTNFLSWRAAIQAAINDAASAGGGTVLLPRSASPYLVDDFIVVHDNVTFVFESWLQLADYTTVGHIFEANGNNIRVVNPMIDCSGIYAGGSGQNGMTGIGNNIKFVGGYVKNCARGNAGGKDGGKGVQFESTHSDIIVDGTTFDNCFMAMSTQHDFVANSPCGPLLLTNITAKNCGILLFARQVSGTDTTGQAHSVALTNFIAENCGTYQGVFQFSRAANVRVDNGTISNSSAVDSLIRGNHRFSRFDNIEFAGDCNSLINIDPSDYALDSSYPVENNAYDIKHVGTTSYVGWASPSTPNRILKDCDVSARLSADVATKLTGDELRNGTAILNLRQGTTSVVTTPAQLFLDGKSKISDFATGVNIPRMSAYGIKFPSAQVPSTDPNTLDDYEEGQWTPADSSGAGMTLAAAYGDYIKIGRLVIASFRVTFPTNATTYSTLISGLPFASANNSGRVVCGLSLRYTDFGGLITAANNPGASAFALASGTGAILKNADVSGKTVDGLLTYLAAQ